MKQEAVAYCRVLNRIFWKIPLGEHTKKGLGDRIAAEATERLTIQYKRSKYRILWDDLKETFYIQCK